MTLVDADGELLARVIEATNADTPEDAVDRALWLALVLDNPGELLAPRDRERDVEAARREARP